MKIRLLQILAMVSFCFGVYCSLEFNYSQSSVFSVCPVISNQVVDIREDWQRSVIQKINTENIGTFLLVIAALCLFLSFYYASSLRKTRDGLRQINSWITFTKISGFIDTDSELYRLWHKKPLAQPTETNEDVDSVVQEMQQMESLIFDDEP